MRRHRTVVRVAGGAVAALALLALIIAGSHYAGHQVSGDLADADAAKPGGENYIITIPDLAAPPMTASTPDAEMPEQVILASASPLADALSVRLDGVPSSGSAGAELNQVSFAVPSVVPPVQVAGSIVEDAFGPLTTDPNLGAFSASNSGLGGANLASHIPLDGGGGGGNDQAGQRDLTGPGDALDLPDLPPFPDLPRVVPEPTALDLFQLALALFVGLAFRRLRA